MKTRMIRVHRTLPRFLFAAVFKAFMLLWFVPLSWAQGPVQPPSFLGLKDFPQARVVFREYHPDSTYVLALSTYKKVGGITSADREQRVAGDVSRRTLELAENYSALEGFEFYRKQLSEFALRELFACRERECGGSINWANNHFNVIQLYGLDQHQYYGVYEVVEDGRVYYASLYAVRRGNRRVYVQLDLVRTPEDSHETLAMNPATFHHNLQESHFFVMPGLDVTGSDGNWEVTVSGGAIEALAALLRQEPQWHIALVGHDYGVGTLAEQKAHSLKYAGKVLDALKDKGISEERVSIYGLGSLAPAGRGERSARVEVVRLPRGG
ncbi:DUF4892 domain-containing protein [Marinimicrobium agarilyticum]|uniref:DUF4892 domain-containing protein n=1 Tax=Marinimicrobium agarilyticum TaxID=306546 RepID=UPI00146CBC2E|nr:DUF4892 domain-containing protein [Marinimicrobium agarilyticum]